MMPVYSAIYDGPPRRYGSTPTNKKWITIHNTSNARDASAEDEASYAKNRTDGTSSHYYVDRNSIVQSLNTDLRANHVGSTTGNNGGISYEITGTNAKTRAWWMENVAWDLLVKQIRIDCAEHDITPRLLTVQQIKDGDLTGIITHNQARLAWGGTDHTDPGPNFPLDHLIALLKGTTEEDDMPLTKADANTLLNTDGLIEAPPYALKTDPKNTHWGAGSYLRSTRERVETLMSETRAVRAGQAAILAAVQGVDTDAVIAAVNAAAAADAARDTALLTELRDLASGGATADEIVDQLAARLSGAGE
jgi:N-acetyl-anhydromuramyl-L-alanine amidase AmpD